MKHYTTITPPAQEPVSVAEATRYLRAGTSADESADIGFFIQVAREQVEDFTGRAISLTGYRLVTEGWGDGEEMNLDRSPLRAVVSVKYYAYGETSLTTLSTDDYIVITGTTPGGIVFISEDLPELAERPDAVQVEFTAGPDDPAASPARLRHAVKLLVSDLDQIRAAVNVGNIVNELPHLKNLLTPLRVGGAFA